MVERGTGTKSLMERLKGCQELGCCLAVSYVSRMISPLSGVPCPPFYRPRGEQGLQMGERRKNQRQRKSFEDVGSSFSLEPALLTWQTTPRITCFADPDRAGL